MRAQFAAIMAAVALLALSGCENGKFAYGNAIRDFSSVTGFGAEETPPIEVETQPGPPLIVGFEAIRVALPYGGKSGDSDTYVSPDGVTIAMNDGFVTRATGLGIDMQGSYLDSESPWFRGLATAAREGASTNRVIEYWERKKLKRDKFRCTLAMETRETGGTVVDETCKRFFEPERFVNRYWLDAEGRIECSRQWIHPKLSPLQFFRTEQQALTLDLTKGGC